MYDWRKTRGKSGEGIIGEAQWLIMEAMGEELAGRGGNLEGKRGRQ
jgi:hypothetical protein